LFYESCIGIILAKEAQAVADSTTWALRWNPIIALVDESHKQTPLVATGTTTALMTST
jgi:hypothetical protein